MISGRTRDAWPRVAVATLYKQDLLTRHTGRVVRSSIEGMVAEQGTHVLIVLDFAAVRIIDFSCADEVAAKLVLGALQAGSLERFFLFRGIEDHHLDTVAFALERRDLAVAAERRSGEPLLIGNVAPDERRAWETVCALGSSRVSAVAGDLGRAEADMLPVLDGLHGRRLLWRCGDEYVSLFRALAEGPADADTLVPPG